MFLSYVLSFFKKEDTIQGGRLFKGGMLFREIGYTNQSQCCISKRKYNYRNSSNRTVFGNKKTCLTGNLSYWRSFCDINL